ncbi:hypothetical protein Tco_1577622 [Tanacetum coccineum]
MNPLIVQQHALDDALVAHDNPFLVIVDVLEIYMHSFWFTITKIKDSTSYKFNPDNKSFKVGVEVFHDVLQICPRIRNQEFVEPPTHEETVAFIKELEECGIFELIWEDFMYQIDNQQSTAARRSNMPYPRFTKAIIQHFISKDKTISMWNNMFMHGVKNDSVLRFIKFVSKYEIRQVYGKLITNVLVSKEMLKSEAYRTYLDYATRKVIPKEAKKRTKAHMKETYLTADDNIIPNDPDAALELAKSISRTEAEEQEAARLVHETHERLVTEHPTGRRRQTGVTIRDTHTVTKKKTPEQPLKLKGMEMLSDAAILVADIKKALKASKRDFGSQHQTGGSCEGAGSEPEIPDESKGKTKDTNKGVGSKQSNDERTKSDDDKSIDLNKTDDEEEDQGDEFVHTPDDYVPTDDETQDVDNEEYHRINEELYGDVNVEMKDVETLVSFLTEIKHISFNFFTSSYLVLKRTSESYLSIHNDDGNPSRANIKQALRSKDLYKDGHGSTWFQQSQRFIATCSYPTDMVIQNKERYEHVSPKVTSSESKRLQDDDKRLDLVDDLKEAQDHMQVKLKEQVQV